MQKQTYKKRHTKYRGALLLQVCRSIHNILLSKPVQSHPHTKNNNFACTVRPFGALACFNALFRAYPFSTFMEYEGRNITDEGFNALFRAYPFSTVQRMEKK